MTWSGKRHAPVHAASASWPAHQLHDRIVEVYKSSERLRLAQTGGDVPGVSEDRSARCFRSQVSIAPEQPPMIGTWPSPQSCGTDAVEGAQRSISILFVESATTWSESMKYSAGGWTSAEERVRCVTIEVNVANSITLNPAARAWPADAIVIHDSEKWQTMKWTDEKATEKRKKLHLNIKLSTEV